MTREGSARILATIPDRYAPDFAERLDGRTNIAKAIRGRIETVETDLGGADGLTHARRSLIRRAVWLEAIVEHSEQRLAAGEGIDLGGHTQAINTLIGLYRLLGLERRQRPVKRLHDVMAEPVASTSATEDVAAPSEPEEAAEPAEPTEATAEEVSE